MEISITRALSMIKLLDSKINKKINNTTFVSQKKKSSKKINNMYSKEEFSKEVLSSYQSIKDLMEQRKIIKSLIVHSNANNVVKVGTQEMTVADAIERKKSIEFDKELLENMKHQLRLVSHEVINKNEQMEMNLDKLLQSMLGSDKKDNGSDEFSKGYREQNGYEIIDPLKINKIIKELEEQIEDFESNVDFVLSESNAKNIINIPD